ncbi:N-6 DNA methylase [Streptomyces sp. NPDC088925]|uniref:N-6 DNA methylase n=1 Tax=Streptomyces sp. NPDC088925 TaxID=3365914 RepID=UPI003817886A
MSDQLDLFDQEPDPALTPLPDTFRSTPRRTGSTEAPRPAAAIRPEASPRPLPAQPRPLPPPKADRANGAAFGEAIAEAWYGGHASGDIEIPLGLVATLALWPTKGHPRALADLLSPLAGPDIIRCVNDVATYWWMRRPDLIGVAHHLFRWAEEEQDAHRLALVERVWKVAIRRGALDFTGSPEPIRNAEIDLMSWTITNLRHHGARKGLGEYHTPPEVAEVMARFTIAEIPDGGRILDPAAGTGGLLRAAALQLHEMGRDPSTYAWFAQDVDPLSAGGCAVNFLVWGLGPKAMVACGNSLSEPDGYERALRHRVEMERRRDDMASLAAWLGAAAQVEALLQETSTPGSLEREAELADRN